jgi:hypothetical protein
MNRGGFRIAPPHRILPHHGDYTRTVVVAICDSSLMMSVTGGLQRSCEIDVNAARCRSGNANASRVTLRCDQTAKLSRNICPPRERCSRHATDTPCCLGVLPPRSATVVRKNLRPLQRAKLRTWTPSHWNPWRGHQHRHHPARFCGLARNALGAAKS